MSNAEPNNPSDLTPVIERFREIAATILAAKDLPLDPWIYRYCGSVPADAGRYVRYNADLLRLTGLADRHPVVVDAGCGFGFAMLVDVLLGASRVRGIEINAEMVRSVNAYLPLVPDQIASNLEICQGTVHEMPYSAGSCDVVISNEAISHYLDVDAFIDEAFRVLRPGGALVIADGNNGSNPLVRRRTYDVWEAFEHGQAGETIHGHALGKPYVEVRQALLDERFPQIPAGLRADIARRTAGYTEQQVLDAAREHLQNGTLPNRIYRRGEVAIAPDGTAMERMFSPRDLARTLKRRGFDAKAYGYWGGASGSALLRTANRLLGTASAITIPAAPSFRVVAHKV